MNAFSAWDFEYITPIAFLFFMFLLTLPFIIIILRVYFRKRNKITLWLALEFLFFGLTTLHQFLDKFSKYILPERFFPNSPYFYNFLYFRGTFFLILANLMFFQIFLEIFLVRDDAEKKVSKIQIFYYIFTAAALIFHVLPLYGEYLIDVASAIGLVHSLSIYIPMFLKSVQLYRKIDADQSERFAIYFFILMSIGFILLCLFAIGDILLGLLASINFGVFFYLYWMFGFFALFTGYIGFTYPKWFKKIVESRHKS